MLNLALRSCGFYINSTKQTENKWGSNFFGETSQRCGSSHDTLFGCTNTTFTDQNGESEGDVVFINTNRTSNERLLEGQDPRYYSLSAIPDIENASLNMSVSDFEPPDFPSFQRQDPVGDETASEYVFAVIPWCSTSRFPYRLHLWHRIKYATSDTRVVLLLTDPRLRQ